MLVFFSSNFKFEDVMVSDAFLRSICSQNYSAGVNLNMKGLGSIMAHTIGHNFGIKHDDSDCMCEKKYCIMSSILSTWPPTTWSYCSFADLSKLFYLGLDYCLRYWYLFLNFTLYPVYTRVGSGSEVTSFSTHCLILETLRVYVVELNAASWCIIRAKKLK